MIRLIFLECKFLETFSLYTHIIFWFLLRRHGMALDCSKPEGIGQSTICNVQSFTAKITSGDYIPSIGFCRAHYFGTKIQDSLNGKI